MKQYFFYSKSDSKKEPINKELAHSLEEAIELFTSQKQIGVDEFNKLFSVELVDE
jgi:hypothetical protein